MIINQPCLQTIYSYILTVSRGILPRMQSPNSQLAETFLEEEKLSRVFRTVRALWHHFLQMTPRKRHPSVTGHWPDLSPVPFSLTARCLPSPLPPNTQYLHSDSSRNIMKQWVQSMIFPGHFPVGRPQKKRNELSVFCKSRENNDMILNIENPKDNSFSIEASSMSLLTKCIPRSCDCEMDLRWITLYFSIY